ncbi:TetR/AcrR family transcriptional regulator [Novosphingobium sp. BL-52-GroH]|uniref:TetR/AcrR family transcriptional regulator n=1 Tax=Novosphingobium sp. BL-52-GroH TaxID=3349877 RepID=UPI0038513BB8
MTIGAVDSTEKGITFAAEPRHLKLAECDSPQRSMRIMREATEIFLNRGFAGATIDDIAQAAGVGKVAIYQLFGDKTELFSQCMIDAAGSNPVMSRALLRTDRPIREVLVDFAEQHVRRMLRPVFGTRPFYVFVRVLLSASITHPELSGRCLGILHCDEGVPLEQYFASMIESGNLAGDDARFLSRHFMQMVFFTNNVILEPASAEQYRDPRRAAERVVDIFLNGCATVRLPSAGAGQPRT